MNIMQSPNTGVGRKLYSPAELEIFAGFDQMMAEDEKRWNPPTCHFTSMFKDESDCEMWWECRHCGHTKLIQSKSVY